MTPREELQELIASLPEDQIEHAGKVLRSLRGHRRPRFGRSSGKTAARPIEDIAAELAAEVPAQEWDRLPADLTDNLDHYLYGTPKR